MCYLVFCTLLQALFRFLCTVTCRYLGFCALLQVALIFVDGCRLWPIFLCIVTRCFLDFLYEMPQFLCIISVFFVCKILFSGLFQVCSAFLVLHACTVSGLFCMVLYNIALDVCPLCCVSALCTISSLLYVFTLGCMHPLLRFCLLQVYFRTLFLVSMPIAHCATLAVCLFYHISLTPFMPFLCSSISLPWFLVGMLPQSFKHTSLTFTMS